MPKQKESNFYSPANEPDISIPAISPALTDNPAVSKKSRKRIVGLPDKMNYRLNHFAGNLCSQKTNTIGVIAGKLISNFMITAIAGIENIANSKSYCLLISQSPGTHQKEVIGVKILFNSPVDGVLVSLAFNNCTPNHFNTFSDKLICCNPYNFINKQVIISAVLS